ncbi:MAG: CotH kinase family protein [Lachnospiraceae bacterium]|nr:CotH kinase family protein [Lachnospiraceae bacterium]
MEFIKKYFWVFCATVAILGMAVLAVKICDGNKIPIWVEIEQNDSAEKILAWYDAESSINYFFLPAYVNSENTKVRTDGDISIMSKGKSLNDGINPFALFEIDKEYEIETTGLLKHKYKVELVVADNTSTMYINTITGSMREVFKKKKQEEPASMSVYTREGFKNTHVSSMTINGRGNSTWEEDKKAFTLKLNEVTPILDMAGSSKWILLANAKDKSNLKNKIVYDLAKREGLRLTPDSEYTALYLNGEFYGLYLLCQSPNTVNEWADNSNDLRVCKFEISGRVQAAENGFLVGERNVPVESILPKKVTPDNLSVLQRKIEEVDKKICEGAENQIDLSQFIDIDSWTKKYLIDEIFENYDAGICSAYFFWDEGSFDGKIYTGPIWDYDNAMGSSYILTQNPAAIIASHEYRRPEQMRYWYPELCGNEAFYEKVKDTYSERFSTALEYLANEYIPNMCDEISQAVRCDEIRWKYECASVVDELVQYLTERKSFLDSYWIKCDRYCAVRGYAPEAYKDYFYEYVPYGKTINDSAYVFSFFKDDEYIPVIEETDEVFDLSAGIYDDINLVFEKKSSNFVERYKSVLYTGAYKMVPITVIIIIALTIGLIIRERIRRNGG